ncbi:sporulation protein [Pontibacillus litoralis JSM 072002]|uniref:Sporulation protein n=1 Tax=Pontibacillus litoralis JSM 072002 TaxID=1385512 RepID=A0A0A5G0Q3_9BACI|nr:sporulation protein [Pontibacillus litoralis JSM 072002]
MSSVIGSLWIINESIEPKIMEIAQFRTDQLARDAIIEAVNKKVVDNLEPDDIVIVEKNKDGYISSVGWNTAMINRVQRDTYFRVQQYLERLEKGESLDSALDIDLDDEPETSREELLERPTLTQIPLGQATNNALLANLGPKIPVHFQTIGDVETTVSKERYDYGINSAEFEVSVNVKVRLRIVLPFSTDTTEVETNILVAQNAFNGEVPEFYNESQGGEGMNPSIEIPSSPLSSP